MKIHLKVPESYYRNDNFRGQDPREIGLLFGATSANLKAVAEKLSRASGLSQGSDDNNYNLGPTKHETQTFCLDI